MFAASQAPFYRLPTKAIVAFGAVKDVCFVAVFAKPTFAAKIIIATMALRAMNTILIALRQTFAADGMLHAGTIGISLLTSHDKAHTAPLTFQVAAIHTMPRDRAPFTVASISSIVFEMFTTVLTMVCQAPIIQARITPLITS